LQGGPQASPGSPALELGLGEEAFAIPLPIPIPPLMGSQAGECVPREDDQLGAGNAPVNSFANQREARSAWDTPAGGRFAHAGLERLPERFD
jgi:hypothetical protein